MVLEMEKPAHGHEMRREGTVVLLSAVYLFCFYAGSRGGLGLVLVSGSHAWEEAALAFAGAR